VGDPATRLPVRGVSAADTRIEVCGPLLVRWRGERVEAVWPGEAVPAGAEGLLAPLLSRD